MSFYTLQLIVFRAAVFLRLGITYLKRSTKPINYSTFLEYYNNEFIVPSQRKVGSLPLKLMFPSHITAANTLHLLVFYKTVLLLEH